MSEPHSLYLRVRLSKQAYERYLTGTTVDARRFSDWMDWLTKAKMYGAAFTPEKIAEIAQGTCKRSMAEEIAAWTASAWALAKSHYDELTETWVFGIAQFSENYYECLEMLPPLRAVDRFKDRPGVDFILVYNHFWNPEYYMVLFEIREGVSVIAGSPGQGMPFPQRYADEARAFIQSIVPTSEAS
jgi:hypothetical protein